MRRAAVRRHPWVAAPACPFRRLWAAAGARGAPVDAVANIEYDADGYELRIDDLGLVMRFATDCSVVSMRKRK